MSRRVRVVSGLVAIVTVVGLALLLAVPSAPVTAFGGHLSLGPPVRSESGTFVTPLPLSHARPSSTIGGHQLNSGVTNPVAAAAPNDRIAVDPTQGMLYTLSLSAGYLTSVWISNGTLNRFLLLTPPIGYPYYPRDLAVDPVHHNLYVTVADLSTSTGWIDVLNDTTFSPVANISSFVGPNAATFEPSLIVYEPTTAQMFVVNISGNSGYIDLQTINTTREAANASVSITCAGAACFAEGIVATASVLVISVDNADFMTLNPSTLLHLTYVGFLLDAGMRTGPLGWDPVTNDVWFVNFTYGARNVDVLNLTTTTSLGNVTMNWPSAATYDPASETMIVSAQSDPLESHPVLNVYNATLSLLATDVIPSVQYTGFSELVSVSGSVDTLYTAGSPNGTTRAFPLTGGSPYLGTSTEFTTIPAVQEGVAVDPALGEYYVLTAQPNGVQAFTASDRTLAWGLAMPQLQCPFQIMADPVQGLLYVNDICTGSVYVLSAATGSVIGHVVVAATLGYTYTAALDPQNDILYVTDLYDTAIWVYDTSGGGLPREMEVVNPGYGSCGLTVYPAGDEAMFTSCSNNITVISPTSTSVVAVYTLPTATSFPIVVTPQGVILSGDYYAANVTEVDARNGNFLGNISLGAGFAPESLTLDTVDPFLVVTDGQAPRLELVNLTAGAVASSIPAPSWTRGGDFDPSSGTFYIPTRSTGQMIWYQVVPFPTTPSGVLATPGNNSVRVTWSASNGVLGYPILNYTVEWSSSPSGPWSTGLTVSSGLSASLTGLTDGTRYYFTVFASSNAGASSLATAASAVPVGVPYPPATLVASAVNTSAINVSWTAPVSNDGSPITGYALSYASSSSGPWTNLTEGLSLHALVGGLRSGTTYYFQVTATNGAGTGNPSVRASAVTLSPPSSGLLTGSGLYLLVGIIVVLAAVVAAVALVMRRRRKPAAAPSPWSGPGATTAPPTPPPGAVEPPPGATGIPPPPPPG